MAGQDPSPQTTLVVLLGASEWPLSSNEFTSSQAFLNSAHSLKEYFLNPQQFGLPENNLLDLFDSIQSADDIDGSISDFLERRVQAMKDAGNAAQDLLVYYIGHGAFAGQDSEFCLAIRRTRSKSLRASSIWMQSLADTLKEAARNLRRILILDCCFAASAFHAFQSAPGEVARQQTLEVFEVKAKGVGFPRKGTTLLCSSGPKIASMISKDNKYTMFTQALLQTLSQGNIHSQGYLSLRNIAELTANILRDMPGGDAPRPYLNSPDQSEGDVADIPFFPNLAFAHGWNLARRVERRKVLISYSHNDSIVKWIEQLLKRLRVHLAPLERTGILEFWDDTRITADMKGNEELQTAVESSAIVVVLVSAGYLASDFMVEDKLPKLLLHAAAGGTRVIPLMLTPCWAERTDLYEFQFLNPPSKPLSSMKPADREKTLATLVGVIYEELAREKAQ